MVCFGLVIITKYNFIQITASAAGYYDIFYLQQPLLKVSYINIAIAKRGHILRVASFTARSERLK